VLATPARQRGRQKGGPGLVAHSTSRSYASPTLGLRFSKKAHRQ
jgi:hypothetical protein